MGGATLTSGTATRGARIKYQPALDGLRGVMIVAVVAWDFGYAFGPGSVLCLDSLFALSGFLITALLLAEHGRKGRIDLKSFWSRRARRILPAMFLLVIGALVYALVWARPQELPGLRADSFATLLYYMNWHEISAGVSYFAQNAPKSFLKHTWSLAIEEQFYLLWPLVVVLLLKVRNGALRLLFWTTLTLTLGSALWMAFLYSSSGTDRLYFGTDTRAQSLLIGATAAILCARWGKVRTPHGERGVMLLGILGVVGTAVAWVVLDQSEAPMWNGGFLLAAGSATLIMVSVTQSSTVTVLGRSLSTKWLRWLGEISYGIYLWHWPIRIVVSSERTGLDGVSLLVVRSALTLAFGAASYYWLERPIRLGAIKGYAGRLAAPAATVVLVLAVIGVTQTTLPSVPSITASAAKPGTAVKDIVSQAPPPAEVTAADERIRVMFVGDSNGALIGENWSKFHGGSDIVSVNESRLGCGLSRVGEQIYHEERWDDLAPECAAWGEEWPAVVESLDPDVVVASYGAWDIYDRRVDGDIVEFGSPEFDRQELAEMQAAVDILGAHGARVIVLTVPCFRWLEADDGSLPPESDPARVDHMNALWRQVASRNPATVEIVDIFNWACPGGEYTDWRDGVYLRGDGQHFTVPALEQLNAMLLPRVLAGAARTRVAAL